MLISNAALSDLGNYYCVISNSFGSINSDTVTLSIEVAPNLTSSPSSVSNCLGTSATFNVTANGSAPLSYQWYNTNGLVSGGTNPTYTINSITANDASNYYCIVTNACGFDQSSGATLTYKTSPTISTLPSSYSVCESNPIPLSVSATANPGPTYQWYKGNSSILGSNSAAYIINSVDSNDAASYYCDISNVCNSVQTSSKTLTVQNNPNISFVSSSDTVCEGLTKVLYLNASGSSNISYQWYKNSQLLAGSTSNMLLLPYINTNDAGTYYCIANNQCGSTQSQNIEISINENVSFISQSGDSVKCEGDNTSFEVNVSGTSPFAYQWYFNGSQIANVNSNYLAKNNLVLSDNGSCYCKVTNICNTINSNNKNLSVNANPIAKSARYKISVIDTCGNESDLSSGHKTMHLTVNKGAGSAWNLIWDKYEGFQVSTYKIYRADTSLNWTLIDSVAGGMWTYVDANPPAGGLYYQVEIVKPGGACNPNKTNTNYNSSQSNVANNGMIAPSILQSDFFANPTQGIVPLVVNFYSDVSGGIPTAWYWNFGDGSTSTSENPVHLHDNIGLYDVTLTVSNADGTNSNTKFNYIDVLVDGFEINENVYEVSIKPNPFTNITQISYYLPNNAEVHFEVYNSIGEKIVDKGSVNLNSGYYNYEFKAESGSRAQGVFYLRLRIDDNVLSKKLIHIR